MFSLCAGEMWAGKSIDPRAKWLGNCTFSVRCCRYLTHILEGLRERVMDYACRQTVGGPN